MTEETALKHVRHSYRDGEEATALSTLDVWLPETNQDGNNPDGIWIVYAPLSSLPNSPYHTSTQF
jgi:hypothetical protein